MWIIIKVVTQKSNALKNYELSYQICLKVNKFSLASHLQVNIFNSPPHTSNPMLNIWHIKKSLRKSYSAKLKGDRNEIFRLPFPNVLWWCLVYNRQYAWTPIYTHIFNENQHSRLVLVYDQAFPHIQIQSFGRNTNYDDNRHFAFRSKIRIRLYM